MNLTRVVFLLSTFSVLSLEAAPLYCPSRFGTTIDMGMSSSDIESRCGKPDHVDKQPTGSTEIEWTTFIYNSSFSSPLNNDILNQSLGEQMPGISTNHQQQSASVEVTFQNGVLVKVSRQSSAQSSTQDCFSSGRVREGMSIRDVIGFCGAPAYSNKRTEARQTSPEIWQYQDKLSRRNVSLIFDEGRLVSVQ